MNFAIDEIENTGILTVVAEEVVDQSDRCKTNQ